MPRHVLIAGCGDLGIRIGLQMAPAGWRVTGLRRNPHVLPRDIEPLAADLAQSGSLSAIPSDIDAVVFCPTAQRADETAYRETYVTGLRNLLQAIAARPRLTLVFVSSTSVYGQTNGFWVDENSPCEPKRFNGQVMLEAEKLALASSLATTIIRFSGIYGPGRERLLDAVQSGQARCQSEPPYWTNRIHQDDCASMVHHVLTLDQAKSLYLGTDRLPAPQHRVIAWLAGRLGVAVPERVGGDSANKRLSCKRMLNSGFKFSYPDFRAGYAALLDDVAVAE